MDEQTAAMIDALPEAGATDELASDALEAEEFDVDLGDAAGGLEQN